MNCIVTAGPTYEPLDEVRRLTNFSTGRLGSELANHLTDLGHQVTLLTGYYAIWRGEVRALQVQTFTSTADLKSRLAALAGDGIGAVFHAAAVSDFTFGKVWERDERGELKACEERKISTRKGRLFAELLPTAKIISNLRAWFPQACLVGWKYELDGDRQHVLEVATRQIQSNQTNACVVNGAAYGEGFGVVGKDGRCAHFKDAPALYAGLDSLLKR